MKQILILFSAIFLLSFSEGKTFEKVNPLLNEEKLNTLHKKMFEVNKTIFLSNNKDISKINGLANQIKAIDVNLNDEQYNIELCKISNIPVKFDLLNKLKEINTICIELKSKYGAEFTQTNVEEAITEILRNTPASDFVIEDDSDGCKRPWRYALCSAGCTAAGTLGYTACLGTTIGAPACWLLVATIQTACIAECSKNYCE